MVKQYRFYGIMILAAFSLLVLAPLTAEAGGALALLCNKKVNCAAFLMPCVTPKIYQVDFKSGPIELEPGESVAITGCGFGEQGGGALAHGT